MTIHFHELSFKNCRAVESEPDGFDTIYCGQNVHKLGSSWCEEHRLRYCVKVSRITIDKRHNYIDNKSLKYGGN